MQRFRFSTAVCDDERHTIHRGATNLVHRPGLTAPSVGGTDAPTGTGDQPLGTGRLVPPFLRN
jgi:hypothetical protein